jgi:hypothetical protein
MTKIIFILLFLVIFFIIAGITFYAYSGGFQRLKISIITAGGETLIYEKITGDYKQSGKVMDKIYYDLLEKDKIETYKGFGIYYDNPQKVAVNKLRSEAGCILEKKDEDKIPVLEKKYAIRTFPTTKYIVTEFPYKNKMSVLFSLMKVYPALNKFTAENGYSEGGATMEIYDIPNQRIIYRKEIK